MNKIVFATNNQHKLEEIRSILGEDFEVLSLSDIGCHEDIPETSDTLEGNAMQKAQYVFDKYGYACFADDTGLEVEALGGEPGIYSARYAALDGDDSISHDSEANMAKLLRKLESIENRKARFRTVIALVQGDKEMLFEGIVEGTILRQRVGNEGFGYDPVFAPLEADGMAFAQMNAEAKNAISHRGRATKKLAEYLCCRQ
jgi:XTP/dITP diphosphohydrolase